MKSIYRILFLFVLVNTGSVLNAKNDSRVDNLVLPTATISGTTTVCQNAAQPLIIFTGSGGTAPYTFTYTVTGGFGNQIIATTSGNSVTVSVPTGAVGTFNYNLISVHDAANLTPEQASTGIAIVTVSSPPIVDFTFTNDNSCSGTIITFTPSVTGNGPFTYAWNFGDLTTSSLQNPNHSYTALGCTSTNFSVTLIVTDANGCTSTKIKTISIIHKPDIAFKDNNSSFAPFDNCQNASASTPSYTLSVGNVSATMCASSYSINWGDGTSASSVSFPITHSYLQLGVFNMVITALGSNGCSNSVTYVVKNVTNPSGGIVSPGSTTNLCAPTVNLQFGLSAWGNNSLGTVYDIDYGDGSPLVHLTQNQLESSTYYNSGNPAASANYPIPHIYTTTSCPSNQTTATVTISNACGTTTGSVSNINIYIKPVADFTFATPSCLNTNVVFTNTSLSGFNQSCTQNSIYTWDFGDGSPTQSTQNGNHTYANVGTYTVTLSAEGYCGIDTKTQPICIEPPLTPLFTLNTSSSCSPQAITATNITVTTDSCSPPTYIWKVVHAPIYCGTSVTAIPNQTTTNASYNFTEPGTYTITLTVTNSCGSFSTSQIVTVKKPPTISSINGILSNYCGPTNLNPTATVNGCAPASSTLTYTWNFPGGIPTTSNLAIPGPISYANAGNYAVELMVSNECGSSAMVTKSFTINDTPVLTNTPLSQTICSGSTTALVNLTSGPTGATFSWTATATAGISGFTPSGTSIIPIQTLSTTNTSSGTVTYAIIPSLGGCPGIVTNYVITVNPAPVITSQPTSSMICLGGTPSVLSVTVSGATGAPTYQWYSNTANDTTSGTAILGETNATYTPPSTLAGTVYYYCIISLPSGGCSNIKTNTATVTVMPNAIITTQPTSTQNLCVGATISTPLSVTTTGGAGTVSYQWYSNLTNTNIGGTSISGATNANYTPPVFTSNGNYYYYVVASPNGNSCSPVTSDPAEIVVVNTPIVTTQPLTSQSLCQGSTPTNLTIVASGGVGATYSYQWYSSISNSNSGATSIIGATTDTFIPPTTSVGTVYYYATVSQTAIGCNTKSNVAQVIVNLSPAIATQPQSSSVCLGQTLTLLSISYTNGTGTPQYQWYSSTINSNSGGTAISGKINATFNPPNSTIGTNYYYCVITFSSGGCSVLTSATATVVINPNPIISNKNTTICSGNPFTIDPVTSGADIVPMGTTYTWVTPITSPAGVITGALAETTPQTSISQTLFNTSTSPATVTYIITPKSVACLGTTFSVLVTVNPAISPNVSSANSSCFGLNNGSFQTNITGGIPFSPGTPYHISWTGPNGFTSFASSISNLTPGDYALSITDKGGCPFLNTYTITEPADIVLTTDSKKNITCFSVADGEIKITISGGTSNYNIAWTKNGIPFATTEDLTNLSPGTYVVTVSDTNNCVPKTASFTITEPPILAVNLVNKTNILCFGDSTGAITVNVVGGTAPYTYAWSGPNGFTSTTQNLAAIFAGTYTLIITDNSGCSKNLTVQITQTPPIIIKAATMPIICYGDNNASINIVVSGGVAPYTIAWSNLGSGTFQNNLSAGDYIITVTDALNCTQTLTVNIPEAPLFSINPVVKNISCFGAKNGSISLNFVGGIAPVKLTWSDSNFAGTTRNNLTPGSYTVTIIDSKPCTITRTFILLEPQLLALSANLTNALDCNNANSGAINLLVSGGSAPFTYDWSNGATTEDLTNIPAGNYLVTVTDANGCSKQAQYSINRPPPIVTNVDTKTDYNCDTKTVKQTFVAQVSGGMPPYQLAWSSGTVSGTNNEFMNTSQNGTVILNATDALGCKSNYTFTVAIPTLGTPSFNITSFAYSTYGNYSINDPIQFSNTATGDYISMIWDFGDGSVSSDLNPIHTFINPKDYVVTQTVTYPLGCIYVQKTTLIIGKGYVLVVPNAFTPNNDSLNDTFRPVTKGLKNVRLDVYDTWGSMIYSETGEVLRGWDGKIKGVNAENGNYYCKVSGETFYETIVYENHPFVLIK